MSEGVLADLHWVAITDEEEGGPAEIFFRAQDVVDALRRVATYHREMADALLPQDHVKRIMHSGFATALTAEADSYDVSIMQALLDHEAEENG